MANLFELLGCMGESSSKSHPPPRRPTRSAGPVTPYVPYRQIYPHTRAPTARAVPHGNPIIPDYPVVPYTEVLAPNQPGLAYSVRHYVPPVYGQPVIATEYYMDEEEGWDDVSWARGSYPSQFPAARVMASGRNVVSQPAPGVIQHPAMGVPRLKPQQIPLESLSGSYRAAAGPVYSGRVHPSRGQFQPMGEPALIEEIGGAMGPEPPSVGVEIENKENDRSVGDDPYYDSNMCGSCFGALPPPYSEPGSPVALSPDAQFERAKVAPLETMKSPRQPVDAVSQTVDFSARSCAYSGIQSPAGQSLVERVPPVDQPLNDQPTKTILEKSQLETTTMAESPVDDSGKSSPRGDLREGKYSLFPFNLSKHEPEIVSLQAGESPSTGPFGCVPDHCVCQNCRSTAPVVEPPSEKVAKSPVKSKKLSSSASEVIQPLQSLSPVISMPTPPTQRKEQGLPLPEGSRLEDSVDKSWPDGRIGEPHSSSSSWDEGREVGVMADFESQSSMPSYNSCASMVQNLPPPRSPPPAASHAIRRELNRSPVVLKTVERSPANGHVKHLTSYWEEKIASAGRPKAESPPPSRATEVNLLI
eukprot:Protomagalhaensia_sp_Gyna_25__722@NODE_1340_length_1926_cov_65_584526_g1072_i0_p1_GENE_NODE_1340_length_1926_cov_65_584526_g1072_i0NODE_1340_length_1926_cov_65_584526_g1072_i0_p1_ORF_typecomplete_len586_score82_93_NODE_1340_length_1926_cov_65_584526_g1072_i01021859